MFCLNECPLNKIIQLAKCEKTLYALFTATINKVYDMISRIT